MYAIVHLNEYLNGIEHFFLINLVIDDKLHTFIH
jgi:hypothetical protein